MTPLVIFGASGHARVILDAARRCGDFHILGFIDKAGPSTGLEVGIPTLGGEDILPQLIPSHPGLAGIVGVGGNQIRTSIVERVKRSFPHFPFAAIVHPTATVAADVTIGAGTFVAAGAVINCDARVGQHCVVNTNASVDHDCTIEDYAFIGPNAALGGGVHLGPKTFVGIGASILPGIHIGSRTSVGAGAVVLADLPDDVTVVGVPARILPKKPGR